MRALIPGMRPRRAATDPLAEVARELAGEDASDPARLAGRVGRLREESALLLRHAADRPGAAADTTLDEIAASVDSLEDAALSLLAGGGDPATVRRHAAELVHRLDGRGTAPAAASRPASSGRARPMEAREVEAFLSGQSWGVLGTSGPEGPYGVPVSYGYEGGVLFVAMREGLKASHLRHSPAVCLTVAEVASPERWRSVVVRGQSVRVGGVERIRGLAAIARQRGVRHETARDLLRAARAMVFRIDAAEATGRLSPP